MDDAEFLSFNKEMIHEFRNNGGRVARHPHALLLLTTVGARSGRPVTSPLTFGVDGGRVFVVASKAGAKANPAWYHNARANPDVTVEIGTETYRARAVIVEPAERDRLFAIIANVAPSLLEFKKETERRFPIVVLAGVPAPAANG